MAPTASQHLDPESAAALARIDAALAPIRAAERFRIALRQTLEIARDLSNSARALRACQSLLRGQPLPELLADPRPAEPRAARKPRSSRRPIESVADEPASLPRESTPTREPAPAAPKPAPTAPVAEAPAPTTSTNVHVPCAPRTHAPAKRDHLATKHRRHVSTRNHLRAFTSISVTAARTSIPTRRIHAAGARPPSRDAPTRANSPARIAAERTPARTNRSPRA